MIENFVYNDIVLYSKGWYQTPDGDTMLDDLGYLFSQIYAWTPKTEDDIARMMMRVLDRLYTEQNKNFNDESPFSYSGFYDEIKNTMRLYNVSFSMAIILMVKSKLFQLKTSEIKLNPPVYGKNKHFRIGRLFGKYPISMTYKEMNKIAQNSFKK